MWERALPRPHHHPVLPLPCPSSCVRPDQPGGGRVTRRMPPCSSLGFGQGFRHTSQDDIFPRVRRPLHVPLDHSTDHLPIYRFPERNKVPDFATFSSLLRITAKYEMPTVQSQLSEIVRDAYPETFEGLAPSKQPGERVFGGSTPHPNEVPNLFVQQKLTSALPMAYYMAA